MDTVSEKMVVMELWTQHLRTKFYYYLNMGVQETRGKVCGKGVRRQGEGMGRRGDEEDEAFKAGVQETEEEREEGDECLPRLAWACLINLRVVGCGGRVRVADITGVCRVNERGQQL